MRRKVGGKVCVGERGAWWSVREGMVVGMVGRCGEHKTRRWQSLVRRSDVEQIFCGGVSERVGSGCGGVSSAWWMVWVQQRRVVRGAARGMCGCGGGCGGGVCEQVRGRVIWWGREWVQGTSRGGTSPSMAW